MRLYDLASVMRSKNAGPFTLTLDILFRSEADFDRVAGSKRFGADAIAALYGVASESVRICPFRKVLAIKVALPRSTSSGSLGDRDVYGCQQHFPLADLEV